MKLADSLTKLLGDSNRPIYAVDKSRQVAYCNSALANWLGMKPKQIVGREVEYHSEPVEADASSSSEPSPLAALCPPPRALAGERCSGTIACVAPDGRLVHRQAEFIPLAAQGGGVLVLLAATDMSPQELSAEVAGESVADELHRAIRLFRRGQATLYSVPSLLGRSSVMEKVRARVAAVAASGANTLIDGPAGSDQAHVARVIHYQSAAETNVGLLPVDCGKLSDDLMRRTLVALQGQDGDARRSPTLLLENLERLSASHQSQLLTAIRQRAIAPRIIATANSAAGSTDEAGREADDAVPGVQAELLDNIATITIRLPRLVERLDDLPLLAQCFLESRNAGRSQQVGSLRPEALDLLALYSWPGELNELREVITAAHRASTTHEITPRDLPAVIHHAASAAAMRRRPSERIVLDQLLAAIEKEAIERALKQAGGNKTEAAELLGMTRPRLYRRLVQLGLTGAGTDAEMVEGPEFIERDAGDSEP